MTNQPLAEVFGYPIDNLSEEAANHRDNKLCPYHNTNTDKCTKNSKEKPLGTCSIFEGDKAVITCPIRFRQNWYITADAAKFVFPKDTLWTSVPEISLKDKNNKSVGKIDFVIVSHDQYGRVLDFAPLEVQSVYITGNITGPFNYYLDNFPKSANMTWTKDANYPKPDYLSSSMKRLVPQIVAKGSIMWQWKKKQAVAVQKCFFDKMPVKPYQVPQEQADMIWLLYDLTFDAALNRQRLKRLEPVYADFQKTMVNFTSYEAGDQEAFKKTLQTKLRKIGHTRTVAEADTEAVDGLH